MKRVPEQSIKIYLTNSKEIHRLPPLPYVLDGTWIGGVFVASQSAQDTVSTHGSRNHDSFRRLESIKHAY